MATPKPAAKPEPSKPAASKHARTLESAAASPDPAVHQVLAEIDNALRNGNADEVERLTEKLNDLGYE